MYLSAYYARQPFLERKRQVQLRKQAFSFAWFIFNDYNTFSVEN